MTQTWPIPQALSDLLALVNQEMRQTDESMVQSALDAVTSSPERVVVVGRNRESQWLGENYSLHRLLDDFHPDEIWNGFHIVRSSDLSGDDVVINCSSSIAPVDVARHLDGLGIGHVPYADVARYCKTWPVPSYISETQMSFQTNPSKWRDLFEAMEDAESKGAFGAVMAFRLTGHPPYLDEFEIRTSEQYMEDFILEGLESPVFLDIGGYHGETTLEFCHRVPSYKTVRVYEPGKTSSRIAQSQVASLRDTSVVNAGVGSHSAWANFADDGSTSATFNESGSDRVPVVALDDEGFDDVHFIKMDIEGWELAALRGARRLIAKNRPTMALACYHNGADPIDIFDEVQAIDDRYTIRFRHYTQGWSESVLFFCPIMQT